MKELNTLEKILQRYEKNPDKKWIEKMDSIMHSKEIQDILDEFQKVYQGTQLSEEQILNYQTIIKIAQVIYNYTGLDTGMDDTVYDALYETVERSGAIMDDYITVPNPNKEVYHHTYKSLRGTLDKIYYLREEDNKEINKSRKGLEEWVKSSERKIKEKTGEDINLWNEDIYVFPKWDGVSVVFTFNKHGKLKQALTRGYTVTNEAQNISHIFKDWVVGPFDDFDRDYGLKTEVMMSENDLYSYNKKYKTTYKNSRSIVSSIINSDDVDDRVSYLQILSLRTSYLMDNGEESLQKLAPAAFNRPFIQCKLSETEKIEEFAMNHRYVDGLRCDGAVIYIINEKIQKLLGRENEKQKFEVAYKFTEESTYSKIVDVEFTTGLFGTINPVAVFEPVKLKGNTIDHASLGSMDRFRELHLAKGDKVKILYDIIPYCQFDETDNKCKRSGKNPIEEPTYCLECGSPLEIRGNTGLYCANEKCPCRKKGKILNYLNKMNIDGISYATIDVLYEEGFVKSIKDLYKLKDQKSKLLNLNRFGKKSIKNLLHSIDANRETTQANFLGSLGIPSVSKKTFQAVLRVMTYDDLIQTCMNEEQENVIGLLSVVPGIAEKTAIKIYEGLQENKKLIEFLEDELDLIDEHLMTNSSGDFSVCFTKIRDKDLEDWIVSKGGTVVDNVTKNTDVLIVPMKGVTSSSTKKAEKYNIDIIPIQEFKDYIINKFNV